MKKLSKRYIKLYEFIKQYKLDHQGNSPSYREIADHMGIGVGAGVAYALGRLEEAGKIRLIRGDDGEARFRSIELVDYDIVLVPVFKPE